MNMSFMVDMTIDLIDKKMYGKIMAHRMIVKGDSVWLSLHVNEAKKKECKKIHNEL